MLGPAKSVVLVLVVTAAQIRALEAGSQVVVR